MLKFIVRKLFYGLAGITWGCHNYFLIFNILPGDPV